MDGPFNGLEFAWIGALNPQHSMWVIKGSTKVLYLGISTNNQTHICLMEQA